VKKGLCRWCFDGVWVACDVIVQYNLVVQQTDLSVNRWGVFRCVLLIVRYLSGLFGVLYLALVDCALHVAFGGIYARAMSLLWVFL
jgi:hypothetical protein